MKPIDAHRTACYLPLGHCPRCELEALAEDLSDLLKQAGRTLKAMVELKAVIRSEREAT